MTAKEFLMAVMVGGISGIVMGAIMFFIKEAWKARQRGKAGR